MNNKNKKSDCYCKNNKNVKSDCHWWEVWCRIKTAIANRKAQKGE